MSAPGSRLRVGIVAGEASGDALGAQLIRAMRVQHPGCEFLGIGGPRMASAGCRVLYPAERLSVRGYVEVLRHLPGLLAVRRGIRRALLEARPDLFVGVDAPDFNLGLERGLRRHGIPTVHYVSPSVWAWRGERVARMREAVDRVLALFPFEPRIYEAAGVPVTFVGHPLADAAPLAPDRGKIRRRLKLDASAPVIALLPGSRVSELERHAALFVAVARRVQAALAQARFLVPLVNRPTRERFEAALGGEPWAERVTLLYGHAETALAAADVALVASGTASLEAALYKCPHVVTYRVHPWTYRIVRRKLRTPWVALPNALAGRFVVAELLQDEATEENLAQALLNLYGDADARRRTVREFERIHESLRQGAAMRAARAVLDLAGARAARAAS